jgi:hypothetical protein
MSATDKEACPIAYSPIPVHRTPGVRQCARKDSITHGEYVSARTGVNPPDIGTDKIESRLQKGELFQHDHLRVFRMS